MSLNDLEDEQKRDKDLRGLICLFLLYMIQGIATSFFMETLKILLMGMGVENTDLGIFSLSALPYSFKFLLAPFVDAFYWRQFGKRKSYIVPILYFHSALSIFYSYRLEHEIIGKEIMMLTFWAFLCTTFMAIQDIAVDSWVITLLSKQSLGYGAMTQTIGLTMGRIFSVNVFIPLSSVSFCNANFYSTPSDTPILTMHMFWMISAVATFGVTFYIHMFVKEDEAHEELKSQPLAVFKTLKYFYKNHNLRNLTLVSLTQYIPIAPISTISGRILIQKGLSIELFANLSTICIPFQFFSSFLISRICAQNKEMRIRIYAYTVWLISSFFSIIIVDQFDKDTNYKTSLFFIIVIMIIESTASEAIFIASLSHANKICNEAISGTFITTRNSIQNFGFTWPSSVSYSLAGLLPWQTLSYVGVLLGIPYTLWMKKTLLHLEGKQSEEFFRAGRKHD